ncbi:MAG TPA: AEC family transporter [Arthrobacter sp.]|nr:AEC family transporter [Arthrobacter sp.]
MDGVLMGFGIVLVLIAVGFGAAAFLPGHAPAMQKGLTPAIYYLTNPALMFILLAETDLGAVLGVYTPIALITAAVSGAVFALLSRFVLRRGTARAAVGAMSSSYVNAGNIGLPIALYAVGSSAPVVSVLLAQLLVVAPIYLAVFSWCSRPNAPAASGSRLGWVSGIVRSFANPVTVATALGAVFALTGWGLPDIVWTPLEMLGHSSIPLLLMLFGMGMYGQKPFAERSARPDVVLSLVVKLVLMPCTAWAIGRLGFGVSGTALFGVVVMAALPTAQNVYLFASQFRMPTAAARDVIFLSSLLSLPAVGLIALLLA